MTQRTLEITGYKIDPPNDTALGIMIDVRGPFEEYSMLMVYFTEEFVREYFKIRWFKDLPKEEHKLFRDHRETFILWAIARVEVWIRKGGKEDKLFIDYEKDAAWAAKVEEGQIKLKSRKEKEDLYIFER